MKRAATVPSVATTKVAGTGSTSVGSRRARHVPVEGVINRCIRSDREGEIERERIAVVEIVRIGNVARTDLELGGECRVGDDGGDLAAFRGDLICASANARVLIRQARAPVAAMERDGDGPSPAACRGSRCPYCIGQDEIRHRSLGFGVFSPTSCCSSRATRSSTAT